MKNKPWEHPLADKLWRNESEYCEWVRGSLRKAWSDYPLRKIWKNSKLRPLSKKEKEDKIFHQSTRKVGMCELCFEWFPGSKLLVDHKISSGGCSTVEHIYGFVEYTINTIPEDWQLACKKCHDIKTHSERQGLSFDEARVIKEVINFEKNNKPVKKLINTMMGMGFSVEDTKNAKTRRLSLIKYFKDSFKHSFKLCLKDST